jgi:N6-adenosine-specific RNA methylase IME4
MSLGQIAECLPALENNGLQIAGGAHLYLWVPNVFLEQGYAVVRAWGFTPKQLITWVKVTKDSVAPFESFSSGPVKVRMGMGHGYRNCTEQVIVAVRGKLPFLRKDQPNVFFAPRGEHSRKPALFHDIVESMSPGPHLELFARPPLRRGWAAWGDEV